MGRAVDAAKFLAKCSESALLVQHAAETAGEVSMQGRGGGREWGTKSVCVPAQACCGCREL